VTPPPDFALANQKPSPLRDGIALETKTTNTPPSGFASADAQIAVQFDAGAITPHPPDTTASIEAVPVDPATLGPLPPGHTVDGNGAEVRLFYEPSRAPIERLDPPAVLHLRFPTHADTLLYARDGQGWTRLKTDVIGGAGGYYVTARFDAPGYYVAALAAPAVTTPAPSPPRGPGTALLAMAAVAAVAIATGVPLILRRRAVTRRPSPRRSLRRTAAARNRRRPRKR
jgi:hypothetical protein